MGPLNPRHHQKLNFVLDCECCCCEQPISAQNFFLTAISLDAHNNNIRNPAQNSASGHHRARDSTCDGSLGESQNDILLGITEARTGPCLHQAHFGPLSAIRGGNVKKKSGGSHVLDDRREVGGHQVGAFTKSSLSRLICQQFEFQAKKRRGLNLECIRCKGVRPGAERCNQGLVPSSFLGANSFLYSSPKLLHPSSPSLPSSKKRGSKSLLCSTPEKVYHIPVNGASWYLNDQQEHFIPYSNTSNIPS